MQFFYSIYTSLEKSIFQALTRKLIGNIAFLFLLQLLLFASIYFNISALRDILASGANPQTDLLNGIADRAIWQAIILILLSTLAVIGSLLFLYHLIVRPVRNMNRQLEAMNSGEINLSNQLQATSHDELLDLANNYNRFLDQFRRTVHSLRKMGTDVAVGSTTVLNQVKEASDKAISQGELSATVFHNSQEATQTLNTSLMQLDVRNVMEQAIMDGHLFMSIFSGMKSLNA